MSIFKLVIKHINNIPVGGTFILSDFKINIMNDIKNFDFRKIHIINRYIDYLNIAEYIVYAYTSIAFETKYIKKCDIPNELTVSILSKMSKNKQYRTAYMRKLKLKQLKCL